MKERRAVLAWSLPLILAAVGAAQANADELSDLRANNQLLQQRLDQLAQAPAAPGGPYGGGAPNPAATTGATGGSFPRSFLIPGTDTSIRISGQITEILDYWMSGGPPNGSPQTTTVGVNGQLHSLPLGSGGAGARGNGIFQQSPRESKLSVETRTPTPWGEARTFMEFDWAGSTNYAPGGADPTSVSDNLHPRLRYAYGTLGGFLAGQANSNFSDSDANSETLDFGGNAGAPGVVRIPQIRYTVPTPWWGSAVSFSLETPETDVLNNVGGLIANDSGVSSGAVSPGTNACTVSGVTGATCTVGAQLAVNPAKATAPDITAAWYIPGPWGHVDISFVVRPGLDFQDGKFVSRQFVGYGGHIGAGIKPGWFGWTKDSIQGHFTAGDAIGRYLNSSTNFALAANYPAAAPTSPAAAANVLVKPTRELGVQLGYTHFWSPNLRSSMTLGYNRHDIPFAVVPSQAGSANKELYTGHVNLVYSPVSFVDMGIEYMYGHRVVLSNASGNENVLIGKFAFKF
jgi:hypothetical protein